MKNLITPHACQDFDTCCVPLCPLDKDTGKRAYVDGEPVCTGAKVSRCGVSLQKFVVDNCANFIDGGCFGSRICKVIYSQQCEHFEKSVLTPVDYKFKPLCFTDDPAFEKRVRSQYRFEHNMPAVEHQKTKTRICSQCQKRPITCRKRYCDTCRNRQRKSTYRESNHKRKTV